MSHAALETKPAVPPPRTFTPVARTIVQRNASDSAAPASAPESVHRTLSSPGRPLDAGARDFMESRFGHDFGHVRVHTDSLAGDSARAINAHAYTAGSDIAFAPGRYQPDSHSGRNLLAHELAHTVQQHGLQRRASDLAVDTAPDSHLEYEADHAAHAVMHGLGAPIIASRLPSAIVSPTPDPNTPNPAEALKRTWIPIPPNPALAAQGVTHIQDGGGGIIAFRVSKFPLPQKKGLPGVIDLWKAKAKAQALESTIAIKGTKVDSTGLWASRDRTSELKSSWLGKVGWPDSAATTSWYDRGGDKLPASDFKPRVKNKTGHMDHIVELQIGGTNARENVQVHDASENTSSGSTIWAYLSRLAQECYGSVATKKPSFILLHFDDVDWDPGPPSNPAAIPAPGAASSVMEVEYAALQKRGPLQPQQSGKNSAGEKTEPYQVEAAGTKDVLQVLQKPKAAYDLGGEENRAPRQLIPGLLLQTIHRPATGNETIEAVIDQTNLLGNAKPTKIPLSVSNTPKSVTFTATQGKLAMLPSNKPAFDFLYPYLSKGHVNLKFDDKEGLAGTGTLTPSLPLLNKLPLKVEMGRGFLRTYLDGKDSSVISKLQTSIPSLRFTTAKLGVDLLPEFKPAGELGFNVGPNPASPYLIGLITVTGDSSGLKLEGAMTVQLPNINPIPGKVWYRNAQWGGEVEIKATDIKFPGVKSGSLKATFGAEGMNLSGHVGMSIAGQDLTLTALRDNKGKWLYRTDATFNIKGLNPVVATITTDGVSVWGGGTASIHYKGITGKLTASYNQAAGSEKGAWSGTVLATFEKGKDPKKAKGSITVHLSTAGNLYGEGTIAYPFTEKLVGSIDIGLSEAGVIKVKGKLTFADVQIFEGKKGVKTFDGIPSVSVPIVGFTLGPLGDVGLVFRIIPTLSADYSVGPGMLTNISMAAGFEINPLSEDLNFAFDAGAKIFIPVAGGVSLGVEAELALAALVVSISAGAGLKARLGLSGALTSAFAIHYEQAFWNAKADTSLLLKPEIKINGYLYVRAEADFKVYAAKAEKRWDILSKSWGSDLEFGLKKATVGYDSRTGFVFPTADKIEWAYPKDLRLKDRIAALVSTSPTSKSG